MFAPYEDGLKVELNEDLEQRVIDHRNRFIQLFTLRYRELLPTLIRYTNTKTTAVNFLKIEVALRNNHRVVIGEATNGKIMVMGYVQNDLTSENPSDLFSTDTLTKKDITFTVNKTLIPNTMKEISYYDDCKTGNFVVMRNKTINYLDDMSILKHYTLELAELVVSRFSIAMQAKINTFFKSNVGDESINRIVTQLYNGAPFVKTNKLFDPEENIVHIENEHMAQNFQELKREYQNKISELNNMLGINSLAVEKSSGVSDAEAKSNRSYTTSNANIYIDSRNESLDKLNKRFNLELEAIYNDDVASELQEIGGDTSVENNDNTV